MKIIELNTKEYEELVKKGLVEEEKKIPEKLPKSVTDNTGSSKDMRLIAITLNEIIDYLKNKGE